MYIFNNVSEKQNEEDVGISEYLGAHAGFVATTKQRYSDFVVNEIDMNGNTILLQDCDNIPLFTKNTLCVESMLDLSTEQVLRDMESNTVHLDYMIKIEENDNKEKRKNIHEFIRQRFPMLSSRTENIENKSIIQKYIIVSHKNKGQSNMRNTAYDDKGLPKYLHFVLYKEGIDTIQAVNKMGRLLRLKTSRFSYAGTKDKRAITTQRMSVFKVEAKRMKELNKLAGPRVVENQVKGGDNVGMGTLKAGDFTYSDHPVPLGSLMGNRFKLILRNVSFPTPLEPCTSPVRVLSRCFDSLSNLGFVNYFGHQRFGASLDTWRIGQALLSGRWAQALDLILRPLAESNRRATPELRHLLEAWARTKNPTLTLESVNYAALRRDTGPTMDDEDPVEKDDAPGSNPQSSEGPLRFGKLADSPEYKLILGLGKYGSSDPLKVISTALHRNLRLMYVHAYQSYVWNRVASALLQVRRASKTCNGTRNSEESLFELRVGDLVRCEKSQPTLETGSPESKSTKKFKSNHETDVYHQSQDEDIDANDETNGALEPVECDVSRGDKSSYKTRSYSVEYITADNKSSYTVYDLVLPLPGYDILYPQSEDCLALYKTILEMDGFKYDEMKRKVKDYSLPGDYRKLLARPQDLRWHLLSDDGTEENVTCIKDIQVEFSLPPSCYATILLRELTKQHYQDLSLF